MSGTVNSLLLVRLSALGDVVHSAHAAAGLAAAVPDIRIGWVVEDRFAPLVRLFDFVAEVFPVRLKSGPAAAARSLAVLSRKAAGRFDAVADVQGLAKSALCARAASGGAAVFGYAPPEARELSHLLYSRKVPAPPGHVARKQAAVLSAAVGVPVSPRPSPPVSPPPLPFPVPEAYAVFVAGSARGNKVWPAGSFVKAAGRIGERLPVFICGGPAERARVVRIAEAAGVSAAPPMDLPTLAAFLARAEVVFGADTGPVHLASALGTPVAAVFGPIAPARNAPLGPSARILASPMECVPCGEKTCPKRPGGPAPCMEDVSPETVAETILEILDHPSRDRRRRPS